MSRLDARIARCETLSPAVTAVPRFMILAVQPSAMGPHTTAARRPGGPSIERRLDETEGAFLARAESELWGPDF